jgi:hypothetical protein
VLEQIYLPFTYIIYRHKQLHNKIPPSMKRIACRAVGYNFSVRINLMKPPLWSSGQSSWLQTQRSGFDSRRYHFFWEVVGMERGSLSLVSTTEELLGRKNRGSGLKSENTAVGIRYADHMAPSIRKSWYWLRRQAAVPRSVYFARGLRQQSFFFWY